MISPQMRSAPEALTHVSHPKPHETSQVVSCDEFQDVGHCDLHLLAATTKGPTTSSASFVATPVPFQSHFLRSWNVS